MLAVIVGVNSVIALFYYARVAKVMWMEPVPDGDRTPVGCRRRSVPCWCLTAVATLAIGVSNLATRLGEPAAR